MWSKISGLVPVSLPLGWDLKYKSGYARRAFSRMGARADSMIPTILICTSTGGLECSFFMKGRMDPLKIAFISEGTPGREKIVVLADSSSTPGAVPTGLGRGFASRGRIAIFLRWVVRLDLVAMFR